MNEKQQQQKFGLPFANCEFIRDLFQRISFVVSIMAVIIHRTEAISPNIIRSLSLSPYCKNHQIGSNGIESKTETKKKPKAIKETNPTWMNIV